MFAYCVQELHLSEDEAYKRIRVARAARRFPAIFDALAEGRLQLTAVVMLAPHLAPENADELLAAAAHQSKAEMEQLLAQRFPGPDVTARVEALLPAPDIGQLVPEPVESHRPGEPPVAPSQVAAPRPRVTPVSPERFALQVTLGRGTHEKLRYAQELLGHRLPSGDIAQVLDRALDALIEKLEKAKFAATTRPRSNGNERPSTNPRHIPADVTRAVWERDGGQCTFVSDTGRRCAARKLLEFDHIEEVARGGRASVTGIRLRCRAHNQYGAECAFGADFMRHKREEARRAADARRAGARAAEARAAVEARRRAAEARAVEEARQKAAEAHAHAAAEEVITPLRLLGFRADEARRAAALCEAIPDAPLEQRLRRALSSLAPRPRPFGPAPSGLGSAP